MAEVLENQEAFSPGAFPTTKTAQERFVLRLLGRRYSRPEIPVHNWMTFMSAGTLTALAGIYLEYRGQNGAARVAFVLMGVHGFLGLFSWIRKLRLKQPIEGGHPHACHLDETGELAIALKEDETIAARLQLDTREKEWIPWVAGLAQTFWGLLLSGIPPVFAMGEARVNFMVVSMTLLTFLGTLLFGKGVRDIWGLRFAKVLFITNQRMVVASGPGEARSVPWNYLKQRPIVVGREEQDEGATLGLALIPLVSVGRLPAFGLWGKDQMNETKARDLAAFVVRSRQTLLDEE